MSHILAEISTKGRTHTTLPLAMISIAMQTRLPDEFILFDDNENPEDLRNIPLYQYIFKIFDEKGIPWKVLFGERKGQHYNHQKAQELAKDLVWRLDDDCVAESNVLETLERWFIHEDALDKNAAIGGLVLDPTNIATGKATGKIEKINSEPNKQWMKGARGSVEHLYSSFLYRKGIANYDLRLSPAAHREETMFTHDIFKKGNNLLVTNEVITWHLRNPEGGIRNSKAEDFAHDEAIFQQWLGTKTKLIVLDSGIGDHIMFKKILPQLQEKYNDITLAVCYPFVFEDDNVKLISIAEARQMTDITHHNVYKWCWDNDWKAEMQGAYLKMYL